MRAREFILEERLDEIGPLFALGVLQLLVQAYRHTKHGEILKTIQQAK